MKKDISVRLLLPTEERSYDLLLLADETKEAINKYIHHPEIYVCEQRNEIIGIYALQLINGDSAEIKNMAIAAPFQGKGLGTYLVEHETELQQKKDCHFYSLVPPIFQKNIVKLYQKAVLKDYRILEDFFIHNYTDPIYEKWSSTQGYDFIEKSS